jgi:hypothetical protein
VAAARRPANAPAQVSVPNVKATDSTAASGASSPPVPAANVQWSCQPKFEGALTVGAKFVLACDGPPVHLDRAHLRFELPKARAYMLRMLDSNSVGETSASLIVTSYVAGEVKFKNPVLSDGQQRVGLGDFEYKVESVITKENNPERKPFGPIAPEALTWPVQLWIVLAATFLLIILAIALLARRSIRRKKFLKLLAQNASALTPYNQFNKDLRKLGRYVSVPGGWTDADSAKYLADLDEAFRWFLARELIIPAIGTRPGTILREVRRHHPELYRAVKKKLYFLLSEIEKARDPKQKSSSEDAHQLTEAARKLADRVQERGA